MFENIKKGVINAKKDFDKKILEKKEAHLERKIEEEKAMKEKAEKEKVELNEEKQRLLELTDKEIAVELVFALRGFYQRVFDLEHMQTELSDSILSIEDKLTSLKNDILALTSSQNNE